jgi:hypothetical protein
MSKKNLSFIELHFEKILAGVGAALLVGLLAWYGIGSPNTVEFNGESVGPRELDGKILAAAEDLRGRVKRAKVETPEVPQYSKILAERFRAGILEPPPGSETPPIPSRLRLTGSFGNPIPKLDEKEERGGEVAIVTPLPPSQPALRAGRSLVVQTEATLGEKKTADDNTPPVELPWVTVAAYLPKSAQQAAMTEAHYATALSKVYAAGVDVERQEMLASGQWSEWKPVAPGKAMPTLDAPTPVIDDTTGQIINRQALDQAFETVKSAQGRIVQPPFYDVKAGDAWQVPPIAGFEDEEPTDEDKPPTPREKKEQERRPREPTGRQPPPGGYPGGGGNRVGVGLGPRGGGPGGFAGDGGRGADDARAKAEGRKQAAEDLKDAKDALAKKDYDAADSKASSVLSNEHANDSQKKQAEKVRAEVEEWRQKESERMAQLNPRGRMPYPVPEVMSQRGAGPAAGVSAQEAALIKHPDKADDPAVWFHDDSVEAGKTYRYRMRVKLWNRYVGRIKQLNDPMQARQTLLVGDWSLPSDSVTVPPGAYFFARSRVPGENTAAVEVFKWRKGAWVREVFEVHVGDAIGHMKETKVDDSDGKPVRESVDFSTGAVVLDIREEPVKVRSSATKDGQFRLTEQNSLIIVYLDPADGQVKERIAAIDRNSPLYKKLKGSEG